MDSIYLFHDRGDAPVTLEKLEEVLRNALPETTNFVRPYLPHVHPGITAEDSYKRISTLFHFQPGDTIIGAGLGGLLAAKYQEQMRWDLKVVALAAPTTADGIVLEKKIENRLALYSSKDDLISPNTNWEDFTHESYEYTPLMFHNIHDNAYMLAYLIKMWLAGKSIAEEILSLK